MSKTGVFNLDFPGATIVCDTKEKRESLLDYIQGVKNSWDIPLDTGCFESSFDAALYNTTYFHEGRHLHDHLVCPLLVQNYVLKLSTLYYSIHLVDTWNKSKGPFKYIPIPFNSWLKMTKEKQLELLSKRGLNENDVPNFSSNNPNNNINGRNPDATTSLFLGGLHYSQYHYNISLNEADGYGAEYSIRTFLETLAFAHQARFLSLKYDSLGDTIFSEIIEKSHSFFKKQGRKQRDLGISTPSSEFIGYLSYTTISTMIWRYVFHEKIPKEYFNMLVSYISFWALSGNVIKDDLSSSTPRNRIERLFNLDRLGIDEYKNLYELFNNPIATFEKWDRLLQDAYNGKKLSIKDAVGGIFPLAADSSPIDLSAFYRPLLSNLFQMSENLQNIGYGSVAKYIHSLAYSIYYMSLKYRNEPKKFLYPDLYIKHLNEYTNVPFRFIYVGVDPITVDECITIRRGITLTDDAVYGNMANENEGTSPMLKFEIYREAEDFITFSNVLFGKTQTDLPGTIIKKYLPGIKPLFI